MPVFGGVFRNEGELFMIVFAATLIFSIPFMYALRTQALEVAEVAKRQKDAAALFYLCLTVIGSIAAIYLSSDFYTRFRYSGTLSSSILIILPLAIPLSCKLFFSKIALPHLFGGID